jgi:hypothetical protein
MKTVRVKGETFLLDDKMATAIGEFFGELLTTNKWEIFEVHTENDTVHKGFKVIASSKLLPGVEHKQQCEACSGQGEAIWSCCTGDRVDEDYSRCPSCGEGLGEEECQECDGTGLVSLNTPQETPTILDPIGQAEAWADRDR